MNKIKEFTLDDGSVIGIELAEVADNGDFATAVSRGDEDDSETPGRFQQAIDKIPAISNALFATLKDINQPKEVELFFSLF